MSEDEVKNLVDALAEALNERHMRESVRRSYTGYEWGYHGHDVEERYDRSIANLKQVLDDIITKPTT